METVASGRDLFVLEDSPKRDARKPHCGHQRPRSIRFMEAQACPSKYCRILYRCCNRCRCGWRKCAGAGAHRITSHSSMPSSNLIRHSPSAVFSCPLIITARRRASRRHELGIRTVLGTRVTSGQRHRVVPSSYISLFFSSWSSGQHGRHQRLRRTRFPVPASIQSTSLCWISRGMVTWMS